MSLRPYLVTLVKRQNDAEISEFFSPVFIMARGPRDALDRVNPHGRCPRPDYYVTFEVKTLFNNESLRRCPTRRYAVSFTRTVDNVEEDES